MISKFKNHLANNFPFLANKKLFLAISGGIDSMVLLHLFHQLDYNFEILHCNFQLRGEESNNDLQFIQCAKNMLKKGTFNIDYNSENHRTYRVHIFPMEYDKYLPHYYNNNQKFLQKRLDPKLIKDSKIFEKAEIRWMSINEISKMRGKFRSFYQNIVDMIIERKNEIKNFIQKRLPYNNKKNVSSKYIMGLDQSKFDDDEEIIEKKEEEIKPKERKNARKSKKNIKSGAKTRRVRFNK